MKSKKTKEKANKQVRFITPFNCTERQMRGALQKYWDILTQDEVLNECLPTTPYLTFRRAKNIKDLLLKSHHVGMTPNTFFGSKGPKWGCKPCNS